jgi:hypothetical protein
LSTDHQHCHHDRVPLLLAALVLLTRQKFRTSSRRDVAIEEVKRPFDHRKQQFAGVRLHGGDVRFLC